jgi:hypothetical protein
MGSTRWSVGRILLIWCAWPILAVALVFIFVRLRGGFSLDLLHGSASALGLTLLVGPPVVATLLWGRR